MPPSISKAHWQLHRLYIALFKNIEESYFAFVVFQNHLNEISSQMHLPIRSHIQWNFTNDECAANKAVVFPRHFVQISAQSVSPIFFETQA